MSGCPNCGTLAGPADRFCRKCGNGLSATEPPSDIVDTETIVRPSRAAARRGLLRRSSATSATATMERPPVEQAYNETDPVQVPAAAPQALAREFVAAPPRPRFPWGDSIALIGSLAVIISSVLDWGGPFTATAPKDISASWLLDPGAAASGPSLGLVVLFAGTLGALVSLISMAAPGFTFLRRGVGLLTLMIPIAFALRTLQSLDGEGGLGKLPAALGIGVSFAAGGALVQFIAGRRRT
jgi:hypothetical protein